MRRRQRRVTRCCRHGAFPASTFGGINAICHSHEQASSVDRDGRHRRHRGQRAWRGRAGDESGVRAPCRGARGCGCCRAARDRGDGVGIASICNGTDQRSTDDKCASIGVDRVGSKPHARPGQQCITGKYARTANRRGASDDVSDAAGHRRATCASSRGDCTKSGLRRLRHGDVRS